MYGQRGRRMAESVLEHLHWATEAGADVNVALKIRLQKLVAVLAVSNRGCLIVPRAWEKYKYLLAPKPGSDEATNTPANNITKRNERLAAPLYKTSANTSSPLLDLYGMLDSVGVDSDLEKLAERCLALVPDTSTLVSALLDWASTPYRAGIARVYLAARAIAQLHSTGIDTDAVILHYLHSSTTISKSGTESVHRAIVDLIRLEAFSVGRYLQWLITSGVLSASDGPTCATSLIVSLPTTGLPIHVVNTRKTLMRRLGYAANENTLVDEALARIDDVISRSATEQVDPFPLPEGSTISALYSISRSICTKLCSVAKDYGVSIGAFTIARDFIERIDDFSSLVSVVKAASVSENGALLATVCDTVNLHAESFAALGRFRDLVDGLTEQYVTLRSRQTPDRTFIVALSDLTQRVPEKAAAVKLLSDDLAICEQQSSLAVCSPASDSLIGMHATSLDSDDDIDAVFASGNTMDDQLMQRVFVRIIQRAEKPPPPGLEPVSRVCGWLSQLRSVDSSGTFDRLIHNYLRALMKGSSDGNFSPDAIASLVASGSVLLSSIADLAKDAESPQVSSAMLKIFISTNVAGCGLNESERYRFRLQQERCRAEHADSLVTLVRTACEMPEFAAEDPHLIRFIIRCVSARPGSVRRIFEDGQHPEVSRTNARRIITAVLQRDSNPDRTTEQFDMRTLVNMANPFSVRPCLEAMRYLKTATTWTADDESALGVAILASFTNRSEVWPQLLESAAESTNRTIHEWAQEQLLSMATDKSSYDSDDAHVCLNQYLELLAVTSKAANKSDDTTAVGNITDRLKDCERQLSELNTTMPEAKDKMPTLLNQLRILLHLCVVHAHALPNESEASEQARGTLLATLCALVVHPKLQIHQGLVEYLFDLSSTLSDSLADITQASSKLQGTHKLPHDARLAFILGNSTSSADSWLALASQVHPAGLQQQRVLSRHPSQQGQTSAWPSGSQPSRQSPVQLQPQHHRWPSQSGHSGLMRQDSRLPVEMKTTPYALRRWEIMPDPTPVMGENDVSLSLGLFGARKV